MSRQKGQSAASWFYGVPGFHSTLALVEAAPVMGRRVCPGGWDPSSHVLPVDMGAAQTKEDSHGICEECLTATRASMAARKALGINALLSPEAVRVRQRAAALLAAECQCDECVSR